MWLFSAAIAAPVVALVSAGGEPRDVLIFTPVAGESAELEVRSTTHATIEVGGPFPSPPPTTTTRTTLLGLTVGSAGDEGYQLLVEVRDVTVTIEPAPARAQRFDPTALRGVSGTLMVDLRGRLIRADWALPAGLDGEQQRSALASLSAVSALLGPVPSEPVGPGARWAVAETLPLGLLDVPLQTIWELAGADGSALAVRTTFSAGSKDAELRLPEDAPFSGRLEALRVEGSGSGRLAIDGLLGSREGQLVAHAELAGWKGIIPVRLVADVRQEQVITRR